jgi:hypothetical protein
MRFQVPQFIEVEDKIFGPLTFKQFIYIAGSIGISVVIFLFLPKFLAFIFAIPILIFGSMLAFYKINGKAFVNIVEAFLKYTITSKLYIWKKIENPRSNDNEKEIPKPAQQVHVPKLSESKLKELTWNLDVKSSENPVTEENSKTGGNSNLKL